jgi:hypothetical protein
LESSLSPEELAEAQEKERILKLLKEEEANRKRSEEENER